MVMEMVVGRFLSSSLPEIDELFCIVNYLTSYL